MKKKFSYLYEFQESEAIKINNLFKFPKFHHESNKGKNKYQTHPIVHYKAYPRFKQTILSLPSKKLYLSLQDCLKYRYSCRKYENKPLSPKKLSDFLYYSAGEKKFINKDKSIHRFYPSAGAKYPLEVYPFILNIKTIKPGIYHYHIKTHSLELLKTNSKNEIFRCFNQPWIKTASALLVVTAVFARTERKYGSRGLRHIYAEYGHLAQNMYLLSIALNMGCCSIGGFIDDTINKLIDCNLMDESVIGVIAIGYPQKKYNLL